MFSGLTPEETFIFRFSLSKGATNVDDALAFVRQRRWRGKPQSGDLTSIEKDRSHFVSGKPNLSIRFAIFLGATIGRFEFPARFIAK